MTETKRDVFEDVLEDLCTLDRQICDESGQSLMAGEPETKLEEAMNRVASLLKYRKRYNEAAENKK
jgi:hypothetical protein